MLKGVAASTGIGIGRAVVVHSEKIDVVRRSIVSQSEEKQRFLDAVEVFVKELEEAQEAVCANVGASEAAILGAQIAIIRDRELVKEVLRTIERQRVNAEYAFHIICKGYIALFSHIEDELLSARAADFQDIRDRMLRILMGINSVDLSHVPEGSVLVAEDIPPSQTAGIDSKRIAGILTKKGTRHSHISIIARALQLPAVVAVEGVFERIKGGESLILDGNSGCVWINPDEQKLAEYRYYAHLETNRQAELEEYRELSTITQDGHEICLAANLAMEQELTLIQEDRADGIGLYRTEFLFMERPQPPSEQEQFETYRRVVAAMEGKPVVIRTLDLGGDKDIPAFPREREANPFLGHRAIRFCLDYPEVFRVQLAAILRASVYGAVQMMIPMITTLEELSQAKKMIEDVKAELTARGDRFAKTVPVGIMIETPAAVLCAEELAAECDFFSIGTNDLTQYTLAVDRTNPSVAALYDTLHPAVLRMIAMTVKAAKKHGIPVSVCGEAAADPLMIPFLVGVGVDELSVNAGSLLCVRKQVSTLSRQAWEKEAAEILGMGSVEQIRSFLREKSETS